MEEELINIFIFVLLISTLALTMAQIFHRRVVKHEERKLELKLEIERAKAAQANQVRSDTSQIEDRLRVLERIATDQSGDLSKQIESLRDHKMGETA